MQYLENRTFICNRRGLMHLYVILKKKNKSSKLHTAPAFAGELKEEKLSLEMASYLPPPRKRSPKAMW